MNKQKKITFVGSGSMAYSLVSGLIADGYKPGSLCVSGPRVPTHFSDELSIRVESDNGRAVGFSDVVVLAVKPHKVKTICEEVASIVRDSRPLVISVAAGVPTASIASWLGTSDLAVVRAMPNTPSAVRVGATGLYAPSVVSSEDRMVAENLFSAVGVAVWLEQESQIDLVAALSGSGPAYIFLIIEVLKTIAEQAGLPEATARVLTIQTVLGAAKMAQDTGEDAVDLRRLVTSPGGTTEQAIQVLQDHDLGLIFRKALEAAVKKARELSDAMSD